jgi:hypothetical protein
MLADIEYNPRRPGPLSAAGLESSESCESATLDLHKFDYQASWLISRRERGFCAPPKKALARDLSGYATNQELAKGIEVEGTFRIGVCLCYG